MLTYEHLQNDKPKPRLLELLDLKSTWADPVWPLPNAKEVPETEFFGYLTSYGFKAEAHTGTRVKLDGENFSLRLFLIDHSIWAGGGFGVLISGSYPRKPTRFFRWSNCDHKWSEKTIGRCLHKYTCEKCKASYEVDSGD